MDTESCYSSTKNTRYASTKPAKTYILSFDNNNTVCTYIYRIASIVLGITNQVHATTKRRAMMISLFAISSWSPWSKHGQWSAKVAHGDCELHWPDRYSPTASYFFCYTSILLAQTFYTHADIIGRTLSERGLPIDLGLHPNYSKARYDWTGTRQITYVYMYRDAKFPSWIPSWILRRAILWM